MTPEQRREYYRKNRAACLAYSRKYRVRNPEKVRGYYRKNKSRVQTYGARYYDANRLRISERRKQHRKNNPELYRVRRRAEYLKIGRARLNEMKRKRMESDANYRILERLRARIRMAVCNARGVKARKSAELIGCSVTSLRVHLEQKFKPGMGWDNIAEWEIDHIIPCAEFDLRDPRQQLQCFHFSNLQPLWTRENRSKGAKILQMVQ